MLQKLLFRLLCKIFQWIFSFMQLGLSFLDSLRHCCYRIWMIFLVCLQVFVPTSAAWCARSRSRSGPPWRPTASRSTGSSTSTRTGRRGWRWWVDLVQIARVIVFLQSWKRPLLILCHDWRYIKYRITSTCHFFSSSLDQIRFFNMASRPRQLWSMKCLEQ